MVDTASVENNSPPAEAAPVWNHVADALRGLQFGTITLIVQDGVVIQVDRTEKKRLAHKSNRA